MMQQGHLACQPVVRVPNLYSGKQYSWPPSCQPVSQSLTSPPPTQRPNAISPLARTAGSSSGSESKSSSILQLSLSSPLTESRWPAPSVRSSRCRRDAGKPESHLATTTAVFHSTHFVGLANPDTHLAHSCHLVAMSPNVPSWLRSPPVFVVVLKTFIEMMSVSIIGGSQGNTEQCRPII